MCFEPEHPINHITTSSSCFAHWMLFASSKRTLSSTSTVTCLPCREASISAFDNVGVPTGAVKCLLDGKHFGIRAAVLIKVNYDERSRKGGGEIHLDGAVFEKSLRGFEHRRSVGTEFFEFQCEFVDEIVDFVEAKQVDRAFNFENEFWKSRYRGRAS